MMKELIINLLRYERIDAIVSTNVVDYRDISYMDIRYIRSGKFYRACTFFTDFWASKGPTGPEYDDAGYFDMSRLSDIAEITSYNTLADLRNVSVPSQHDLKKIYDMLDIAAKQYAWRHLKTVATFAYKARFNYTPMPHVIVTFAQNNKYLGAVSIDMSGATRIISKVDEKILFIAGDISSNDNCQIVKELEENAGQSKIG